MRTYLFVPPEENAELRSLGAEWDATSKRWYVESNEVPAKFARWFSLAKEDEFDEEFTITSDEAFVAATIIPCHQCRAAIEVICIHCKSGTVFGEPLSPFTVVDVRVGPAGLSTSSTARATTRPAGSIFGSAASRPTRGADGSLSR